MAEQDKKVAAEWMYQIILSPHITEKATMGGVYGQMTFKVANWATKPQIRQAVETVFGVRVKNVNTLILKGKTKRFKGRSGQRSDVKKAIVTLAEGDVIDIGASV